MRIEDLAAYEIISRQKIQDLRSEGYLLRHKKSGARIALLSNEDENKVFYIGFKTPPADSTGVAHILDGRIPHCLLLEIFTNHGVGTAIVEDGELDSME